MAHEHDSSTPRKSSDWIDAATIMRIKNLQLRAKTVVEGFYNGLHRSPFHGFSVEFSEHRQYTWGDDLRHIDWRLMARTDRLFIKQFEDETNRRGYLISDFSRSMLYGSGEFPKIEYARTLAATLAYYFTLQRDNVGVFTFDESVVDYLPARFRPGHFRRLLACLENTPKGTGTDLAAPLEQAARLVKKRGLIVFISDLLASIDTLEKSLGHLRARGHEVFLLRVLDPFEVDFPFDKAALFRDVESDQEMYVDGTTARHEYKERFAQHHSAIVDICSNLGIDFFTLTTDQPLEFALFELLSVQARQGRNTARPRRQRRGAG
ncbi:MAG: DUF58 domain-containing protein [Planctomycetales bacterium]|nr:DUF58 domain-containing protein [Planctomycetales bacterium]